MSIAPPIAGAASPAATWRDTRTFRRYAAAVLLPLGPLSVAALRLIMPYYTADDTGTAVDRVAANLGRQDALLWLSVAAMLTLIPSALAAGRLAQRRAPVLALLAVGLLVPAFTALFLGAGDADLRVAGSGLIDRSAAVGWVDRAAGLGPVSLAGTLFVIGHILGYILLGAALWRARVIPAWAAIAVIVSQPVHLVFAVFVPNHPLDALGWGLAALGLAMAATRVLRISDNAWDVEPSPVG